MNVVDELRSACGKASVLDDPASIDPYVTDWRGAFKGRAIAVVRPSKLAEVADVVRICARRRVAIVPQGGNTGLAAGATPLEAHDSIVLNLSRMNAVRDVDASGFTMSVDAGCVLADVRARAETEDRLFPLSLAAEGSAQIGGLISTNAGGTSVLRYGTMRSLVLGLEVVLADGTIVSAMRALRKDNAGYDWKQLFVGAEGTLGVVTGAVLRLVARPRSGQTALVGVRTVDDAVRTFGLLQARLGETLSAFEFFPDRTVALRVANEGTLRRPMIEHPWYLLVEASSAFELGDAWEKALSEAVDRGLAGEVAMASSPSQARDLWAWRESITEHERRAGPSAKHDVSVAISSVPAFVAEATGAVERTFPGTAALAFGHIGDGNVHFNVMLPPAIDRDAVTALVHRIVIRYGGSITAEHGIGRYRREDLAAARSRAEMDVMRAVKRALDPGGLMNPGAIF
jgi:FAD/FMN-containing dehydrogenase